MYDKDRSAARRILVQSPLAGAGRRQTLQAPAGGDHMTVVSMIEAPISKGARTAAIGLVRAFELHRGSGERLSA